MKHLPIVLLCLALGLTVAGTALSHSVTGHIRTGTCLQVECRYDDGQPMSYAAVEIFFNEEELPFQNGRTDRNGRFFFLPDQTGPWRVTVNDGMGTS